MAFPVVGLKALSVRHNRWGELVGRVKLRGGVFLEPPLDRDCRATRGIYIEVGAWGGRDGPK